MTTISSNNTFTGMSAVTPGSRRVSFDSANSGGVQIKRVELTAEQKADLEQRKAVAAAVEAASEKQRLEIEKNKHVESREMYLQNISDLSLENAKKSLGIVQVKIRNHEDAGMNVHGRYGDKEISDLNTYLASLKDYISKKEAAGALLTVASGLNGNSTSPSGQNNSLADGVLRTSGGVALVYQQVQNMISGGDDSANGNATSNP